MGIPLQQLLGHPIFSGCRILAGQKGVSRRVCRISVFDCPFHPELADQILVPGDLFLSCLEQFRKGDSNLQDFLFSLVEHDSAGLLIVSTGNSSVLDVTALAYCGNPSLSSSSAGPGKFLCTDHGRSESISFHRYAKQCQLAETVSNPV